MLTKAGLKRGKYNPSTCHEEKVGMKAMVHGDDFISSGKRKSLRRFRQVLESRFEVSTVVVGDGREDKGLEQDHQDIEGWHYEADQRHGELIVKALNLQEAKLVQTPGEDEKSWHEKGGPRALEQPGREPVPGAGGEGQLPRLGPPGHPVRGQGHMQGYEPHHPR